MLMKPVYLSTPFLVRCLPLSLTICLVFIGGLTELIHAHGTVTFPASRIWNCYLENPENPVSAPCIAAVASHGSQPLYDWNEINQGMANGNHTAVVPDGNLASGGRPGKYGGMDLISPDWVATPVNAGPLTVTWTNSAPHATSYYRVYITNANWNPSMPLTWGNLTLLTETTPSPAAGTVDIPVTLPARTGKHVIFSVWQRSDSPEAFYSVSDVDFGAVLPVTLTSFSVSCSNPSALHWKTGVEHNFSHFEIEASPDGRTFSYLAKKEAKGSSSEYHFGIPSGGGSYYRLKMIDLDGSFKYSTILFCAEKQDEGAFAIFPNPVGDQLIVTLGPSEVHADAEARIVDLTGRIVARYPIHHHDEQSELDVSRLPAGSYYLRIVRAQRVEYSSLILKL